MEWSSPGRRCLSRHTWSTGATADGEKEKGQYNGFMGQKVAATKEKETLSEKNNDILQACKFFFLSMQRFNLQSQANMMHVFQCADTFYFSYFLLIWNEKFSIYNSKVFKLFYREARVEVTVVVFYTYVHECDIYFNIIYNSNIFAILSGSDEQFDITLNSCFWLF